MLTRLGKNAKLTVLGCRFRNTCIYSCGNKRLFSNIINNGQFAASTSDDARVSSYDKLFTYAEPVDVKGIWRAPRNLVFSKEQFDKAYPKDYYGMRIGLPPKDSWMAKYIDPKYDSISPFLWTLLFISPILYYFIVHSLWEIGFLPSKTHSH